ncbi:DEAD/DEAH box helicase [Pseudomonas sp. 5P_3.1_Bac2]|uniref:DEAD/DEAH box helicase n=1 Tax=Pseudomonas sp. 5P_3.1_Bac2 TaxID=2971617 RepID=UPI0021C7D27E|nr:DEAD/DEAH box helicase [Pseudomonas sp. 5P_3.1_Bac2]MCU1716190.1 DEAD/DEAH box helicase [Pseudomonas sp. 5P_3.1_Bac2]
MPSPVQRYKRLFAAALARLFPNTTAYLRADREAQASLRAAHIKAKPAPGKARAKAPAKQAAAKSAGKAEANADKPKRKAPARSKTLPGIYGPAMLPVAAAQITAMRAQVEQAVVAGSLQAPSPEQWAMILSSHPLTRIFAGAGSGKSTTLVLRVLFMLTQLGIKPEQMTVISFTNTSCAELREQLLKTAKSLGYPLEQSQARIMVRTFHSAMAVQAKALLGSPSWFEQLHEQDAAELDNPLAAGRLRPPQQRLLKQAYQQCYSSQPRFAELVHSLLNEPAKASATAKAPLTPFALAGEFSALPLPEAFYAQAGFIESLGLDIAKIELSKLSCSAAERDFVEALQYFMASFNSALAEQGLLSFNNAFAQLTQRLKQPEPLAGELLQPFSHLLIDEFQDISPQIVKWLQAVQGARSAQGEAVSLMAIGDDWQSIYGWRGSSPQLFIDFDRHFPCKAGKGAAKRSAVLNLTHNYRSIAPIISDAELLLVPVACKQDKASQAQRSTQKGEHGVKLVRGFDSKTDLPKLIEQIAQQCAFAAAQAKPERTAVLLLSRRNEPLKAISSQLDKKLPVKTATIHRAKGLQAQVAMIVDDCLAPLSHPLRNALYAYTGLFASSYDQAMQDEALRLGYVAITRGVSRVLWFCNKAQGATKLLAAKARQ